MSRLVVNMHEAKTTLSRLVQRACEGDEVILARDGKLVARLVALGSSGETRQLGRWKGRVRMSDDFNAPLPDDVLDQWYPK